jgi:hypothetical protein
MNCQLENWIEKAKHYKAELDVAKSDLKHYEHNYRIERESKGELKIQLNSMSNKCRDFDDLE